MELSITSRKLGKNFTFFKVEGVGYIYCDMGNSSNHGTLGNQICKGGNLTGSTLTTSDENFLKTCRSWMRQYVAKC